MKDFDYANPESYLWIGIVFVFFLISYISQIVGIMNTRYWIEDNYFILTTGIFNKKRKELNIKRIQSVDMTQGSSIKLLVVWIYKSKHQVMVLS